MVTESLILRCVQQEPKAQYELYRALYRQMMSITTRYERNQQDAVARMNQGFLKILTGIGDRRPEVPFELWSRRIMINTVIDAFRRDKRRKAQEVLDAQMDLPEASEVNDYLRHMEADALNDLLLRVPPMSRNVFNLFAVDGCSHAEIAELLGIGESTSKWHVHHARNLLKKAVGESARTQTTHTTHR
ncbi:MAG: sigma-70 family RNA polymerase sigma factor [Flavobacteriales bacterium]|nr:sigma-70 family RNA polymerase sigma factor [Flavobacteriales bacterium]